MRVLALAACVRGIYYMLSVEQCRVSALLLFIVTKMDP